MKGLRGKIESILFAGLKPGGQKTVAVGAPNESWLWRTRQRIDRWVNGAGSSDPLYLSNRTTGQKIKSWSVVAIPLLILVGGIGLSLSKYLNPPGATPPREPSAAEVAAKLLPNLKDLKLDTVREVEVSEVRIVHEGGTRLVGTVRNKTTHPIASAEITVDLTDAGGTQLGSVNAHVENLPASGTRDFETPIQQQNAYFVLIREITTR